jgi:hypothetical protein
MAGLAVRVLDVGLLRARRRRGHARGLPLWQHHHRPVFHASMGAPEVGEAVYLTMHGMAHSGVRAMEPLMSAFLAAFPKRTSPSST